MSFKINDLDKFLKEDYIDDDEITGEPDIEDQMSKFANVSDADVEGEEGAIPVEASEELSGFEMESDGDGYFITRDGKPVCSVTILCKGVPADMATLEDPSICDAVISNVIDSEKTDEYKQKLIGMGFSINDERATEFLNKAADEIPKMVPESKNHLTDKSNTYLEE